MNKFFIIVCLFNALMLGKLVVDNTEADREADRIEDRREFMEYLMIGHMEKYNITESTYPEVRIRRADAFGSERTLAHAICTQEYLCPILEFRTCIINEPTHRLQWIVAHESAHAIVRGVHGSVEDAHGDEFKAVMKRLGFYGFRFYPWANHACRSTQPDQ